MIGISMWASRIDHIHAQTTRCEYFGKKDDTKPTKSFKSYSASNDLIRTVMSTELSNIVQVNAKI